MRRFTLLIALVVLGTAVTGIDFANAQSSSSSNYSVDESFFGAGGELNSTSTSYSAQQSAGALGVGFSESTNYDANGGFLTQNNAYLEMTVEATTVNFGTLQTGSTSSGSAQAGTCNCSFTVRTYLSSQYLIFSVSAPPTNESGDILTAKATQAVPSADPDVEEFGINVVNNATPNIGANPANYPDNSFADGEAATGYETADQFKYVNGDIIARSQAVASNPATGRTDYTLSYIAKRNAITPAGVYTMNHDLVVVPTY